MIHCDTNLFVMYVIFAWGNLLLKELSSSKQIVKCLYGLESVELILHLGHILLYIDSVPIQTRLCLATRCLYEAQVAD